MILFCSVLMMVIGIQCLEAESLRKMREYQKMQAKIRFILALTLILAVMVSMYFTKQYITGS